MKALNYLLTGEVIKDDLSIYFAKVFGVKL